MIKTGSRIHCYQDKPFLWYELKLFIFSRYNKWFNHNGMQWQTNLKGKSFYPWSFIFRYRQSLERYRTKFLLWPTTSFRGQCKYRKGSSTACFLNVGCFCPLTFPEHSQCCSCYEDEVCCFLVTLCIPNKNTKYYQNPVRPLKQYCVYASQAKVATLLKANVIVPPY